MVQVGGGRAPIPSPGQGNAVDWESLLRRRGWDGERKERLSAGSAGRQGGRAVCGETPGRLRAGRAWAKKVLR